MQQRRQLTPIKKIIKKREKRDTAFSSGSLLEGGGGMVAQPVKLPVVKLRILAVLEAIDSPLMKKQILREVLEELE